MGARNIALAVLVALGGGFLVGYVPSCRRASDLQTRIDRAEQTAQYAMARDLASRLHVEIADRNFGNAADLSTRFFDHVRALSEQPGDSETRERLQQILAEREAISAGLAKNDPGIEPQIRGILKRLLGIGPAAVPGG